MVECQIVVMKDVDSSPLGAAFENFCNKTSGERRKIPGSGRISLPESPGGLEQQRFDDARPTWQIFFALCTNSVCDIWSG